VDERDPGTEPRVTFYLEHGIQDAGLTRSGERRMVSKRMLYVELDAAGHAKHLQYAPYLDYRPLAADEPGVDAILARPECAWISRDLEQRAQTHAVAQVVPEHLAEVLARKVDLIARTEAAVKDRLTKEITYWDHRAEQLKLQEQAGKPNARLNSSEARKRADAMQVRLEKRMGELKLERQISPLPPVILGGMLVVPQGLIATMTGRPAPTLVALADTHRTGAADRRCHRGRRRLLDAGRRRCGPDDARPAPAHLRGIRPRFLVRDVPRRAARRSRSRRGRRVQNPLAPQVEE
jgi:hypothetical protein